MQSSQITITPMPTRKGQYRVLDGDRELVGFDSISRPGAIALETQSGEPVGFYPEFDCPTVAPEAEKTSCLPPAVPRVIVAESTWELHHELRLAAAKIDTAEAVAPGFGAQFIPELRRVLAAIRANSDRVIQDLAARRNDPGAGSDGHGNSHNPSGCSAASAF